MTELKEATLTKRQADKLKGYLDRLKREDFIWELEHGEFCEFLRMILAHISGWLSFSNMPFSPVYRVICAFAYEAWNLWRENKA